MRTLTEILTDVVAALPDSPLRQEVQDALSGMSKIDALSIKMGLTLTERKILEYLLAHRQGTNKQLMDAAGIKTLESLYVHRHRLNKKMRKWVYGTVESYNGGYTLESITQA